jgi:hypothetical protein
MQSAVQSLTATETLLGSPPPAGNSNVTSSSATNPDTEIVPVAELATFGSAGTMSASQAATSALS